MSKMLCISAGLLLTVAFTHLLPEAFEIHENAVSVGWTLLVSVLFLFCLEFALSHQHHSHVNPPEHTISEYIKGSQKRSSGAGNAILIGDAFHNAFGMSHLAVGIVVAVIAAFIFLGGVQRIAAVTEKIVPIMAAFYIVGCVVILVMNYKTLPNAFTQIFVLAFNPQAMAGGVAGVTVQQAMRFGVARGLFSNEAGMGSTPHAHALAKVNHPREQGAVAILGVFIDTFVVLTLTGLVLITSGLIPEGLTGTALTQQHSARRSAGSARCLSPSACSSSRSPPSLGGTSSASPTSRPYLVRKPCRCTASS